MGLRVISTKLSEEEHNRMAEICKESNCNISAFLKQCIVELVEKEEKKIEIPTQETSTIPEFPLKENEIPEPKQEKPIQEKKIAAKIRYQYF